MTGSLRRWVAAAVLLVLAASAEAQEARLYVLADTVALGERFEVALAVDHPAGTQVVVPEVPRDRTGEVSPVLRLGGVEALEMRRFAPQGRPGEARTDSLVYTAVAFAADSAVVGPIPIEIVSRADRQRLQSPSRLVRIGRLTPGPDAEPEPLAPPLPFPSTLPIWVAVGLLSLALLVLAVWATRRALRDRREHSPAAPPVSPHAAAMAGLDALGVALPDGHEASQSWHDALSDTLRAYIDRRLRVRTRERTTREIDATLAASERLDDHLRRDLIAVLTAADLVKFADPRPDAAAADATLGAARTAVDAAEACLVEREETARRAAEAAEAEARTP